MELLIEQIVSVRDEELIEKPKYVTRERWDRIQKMVQEADKKRSLAAGKLLHQMCEAYQIDNPVYGTILNGKPVLLSHPQIAFNLSHSGAYVVLAYEKGKRAVGVDIQQIRTISEEMKKRILHEKEWGYPLDKGLLNRIWAIKESYSKMKGMGLALDFRDIYVDLKESTITDKNGVSISFAEPKAPEGYVMALVSERSGD